MAEDAAREILEIYQGEFEVRFKGGVEPVTVADQIADRLIVDALRAKFPEDLVLSEENGITGDPGRDPARCWFLDPIDGTKEFIKKNGEFAIQIGRVTRGIMDFGLVFRPTTGEAFIAIRGEGCFGCLVSGEWQRLKIPDPGIRPSPLIMAMSRSHPSGLCREVAQEWGDHDQIQMGGVGLKFMEMVRGRAHFYINESNSTKAWDVAGPQVLLEEAGGVVTDLRGKAFRYDPADPYHRFGLLGSSSPVLHQKLLGIIHRLRPGLAGNDGA